MEFSFVPYVPVTKTFTSSGEGYEWHLCEVVYF